MWLQRSRSGLSDGNGSKDGGSKDGSVGSGSNNSLTAMAGFGNRKKDLFWSRQVSALDENVVAIVNQRARPHRPRTVHGVRQEGQLTRRQGEAILVTNVKF